MNSPSDNEPSQSKDRRGEARRSAVAGVGGAIIGAPLLELLGNASGKILGVSSVTLLTTLAITTAILVSFALWRGRA